MRDYSGWSLSLGRWGGVEVRLHAIFLIIAAFTLYFCTIVSASAAIYGVTALAVLLISVVVHEVAHCYAADQFGYSTKQIVIGPLGGLAPVEPLDDPRAEFMISIAGPLANGCMFMLAAGVLVLRGVDFTGLLNPLQPVGLNDPALTMAMFKMLCWVNWLLLVVNLLPAAPLDGGQVLKALLASRYSSWVVKYVALRVAQVTAILLCVAAWLIHRTAGGEAILPPWLPLVVLAITIFFSARSESSLFPEAEESEEDLLGYDFSQGYTSLEQRTARAPRANSEYRARSVWQRWMQSRRDQKQLALLRLEEEEEQTFDQLLVQIHTNGLDSLSQKERALMDRVSLRYRQRKDSV